MRLSCVYLSNIVVILSTITSYIDSTLFDALITLKSRKITMLYACLSLSSLGGII